MDDRAISGEAISAAMTEEEKVAEYERLSAEGQLSDAEIRGTLWPEPAGSDAIVDAWFAAHFHNLGAQLDTPIYNRLHAAKEDLKVRLRAPAPQ